MPAVLRPVLLSLGEHSQPAVAKPTCGSAKRERKESGLEVERPLPSNHPDEEVTPYRAMLDSDRASHAAQ
jgi:hypothetical protein